VFLLRRLAGPQVSLSHFGVSEVVALGIVVVIIVIVVLLVLVSLAISIVVRCY
jgi:hypothetical protein